MTGICEHCGNTGPVHRHHPTGRFQGRPVADLTETLCPECHTKLHRIWQACKLDSNIPTRTVVIRRLFLFLDWRTQPLDAERLHAVATILDRKFVDKEPRP